MILKNPALKDDSPSLFGILERMQQQSSKSCTQLTKQQFEKLLFCYQQAKTNGSCHESPVIREEGVSFNPRPARLAEIILKEASKELSTDLLFEILQAAFYLPTKQPTVNLLANQALNYSKENNFSNDTKTACEILAATFQLDVLRHLHMNSWNKQERQEYASQISNELLPLLNSTSSQRLKVMLKTCLERYL